MVKLSHRMMKRKIAEQGWTQGSLAETLDISDRHVRNLCRKDTDTKLSLCYRISKVFGTTMEDLLVIRKRLITTRRKRST